LLYKLNDKGPKSTLDFFFYFHDQTDQEIRSVLSLGQTNIDDEFDLRSRQLNILFLIHLILCDSNPTNSYYIFSAKYMANKNTYLIPYKHMNQKVNDMISLFQTYEFSNWMLQSINDRMKINFIDISQLKEQAFSYQTSFNKELNTKDQINHLNIKIDILNQKYYYYNVSNNDFDILLLIHCEMYRTQNVLLRPICDAKNGKTVCDINGNEICLNRSMGDPPNCQMSN
ncbi:hypothetical protein MXB_3902, partial [Myxobolus squamalis]